MRNLTFLLLLIMGWSQACSGQIATPTTFQQDNIIARKKLRVGLDTSKYWTSIVQTISAASTHRQGATAKAIHDYCQSLLYTAGTGINIIGNLITNTGDTNAADDITTSSNAGGDLNGPFSNLQINPNAVGSAEIANGSVSNSDLAVMAANTVKVRVGASSGAPQDLALPNFTLLGKTDKITAIHLNDDLDISPDGNLSIAQQGAVTGQTLKWNGTEWTPDDDEVGAPEIGTGTEPVWTLPAKVLATAGESVKVYLGEDATGAISGYTPPYGFFTVDVEGSVDDDFKKVRLSMGEGNVSISRLNPGTGATEGGTVLSPFSVSGPEQVSINTSSGSGSIIIGSAATGTGNTAKKITLNYPVQFWPYTTTERDAFTSVNPGTLIFNTTVGKMQCYDGSTWQNLW